MLPDYEVVTAYHHTTHNYLDSHVPARVYRQYRQQLKRLRWHARAVAACPAQVQAHSILPEAARHDRQDKVQRHTALQEWVYRPISAIYPSSQRLATMRPDQLLIRIGRLQAMCATPDNSQKMCQPAHQF